LRNARRFKKAIVKERKICYNISMYEFMRGDIVIIKNGLVYNTETLSFESKNIYIENGVIASFDKDSDSDIVIDADGAYIIPALIDVHTHGRAGADFIGASDEQLHIMAKAYAAAGIASVMPTIASDTFENMLAAVDRINNFVPSDDEASFVGVHLEGRYLNLAKKGAHADEFLKPLTASELENKEFSECKALHISAALELDGEAFAKKAKEIGATLGLAHTNATYSEAKRAEELGISSYTHLYNCMPPLHHRDGGAVCAALLGDAYAELICDGIHIAPEMVKLTYKCKGHERLTLVSDSMEATGRSDGNYMIAGMKVVVKNGIARTESGALAGSTLSLFEGLTNLMRFCSITLEEALPAVTANPAKQVSIYDRYGSIDIGKSADLIILKKSEMPEIDRMIVRGKLANGGSNET
jgi:N-acetylglucosamine-6-phosphate deacetylase